MLKGLGDMAKLMKQAQEMQSKMVEAQERMTAIEAEGSAGAGMVKAVANAEGALKSLWVDPSLLDGSLVPSQCGRHWRATGEVRGETWEFKVGRRDGRLAAGARGANAQWKEPGQSLPLAAGPPAGHLESVPTAAVWAGCSASEGRYGEPSQRCDSLRSRTSRAPASILHPSNPPILGGERAATGRQATSIITSTHTHSLTLTKKGYHNARSS